MAPIDRTMNTFTRETVINGDPVVVKCLELHGQTFTLEGGLATTIRLEDEWFDDVNDPRSVIAALKDSPVPVDIFTFWQRLPATTPQFEFYQEWDRIAGLRVTTFDHWWTKQ